MSNLIDRSASPRLLSRPTMPTAARGWRCATAPTMRGFEAATTQDGRTGTAGAYVATDKHFSIRSGPPTSRP